MYGPAPLYSSSCKGRRLGRRPWPKPMQPSPRDRALSALLSAAVTALCGYALILGLGVSLPRTPDQALALFDLTPPAPPPERVVPPPVRSAKPAGRAAPPNLRARPKEITAPPPIVVPPTPPVILAAPIPDFGPAASSGASDRPGPGTGAGGEGNGRGAGGSGDGQGGGREIPLRRTRGDIRDSDYPDRLREAGVTGVVGLRFTVGANGRVSACAVTRSSGVPELDALTCRLILKRFRYRPTIDANGRAVADVVTGEQGWGVDEDGRPLRD